MMSPFTFKILTYNIHKGFDIFNREFVLHEIREQLRSVDVDLVFLQEIHGQHSQHETNISDWPEASQFEFLADQVWPHYAYGQNAIYSHGHHGNAILSKYNIELWQNVNLSRFRRASRSLLHGIIHIPDTDSRLHLICVHMDLIGFERSRQLKVLKSYIEDSIPKSEPIIIAGDFNDWNSRMGLRFQSELSMQEAFHLKEGKYAKTFPSSWPILRMDRIYFRDMELLECECYRDKPWKKMSDHSPLYAKFIVNSFNK
jgi:endonuclease/exonuclease/phosphatase family metal-dependent hydrolase